MEKIYKGLTPHNDAQKGEIAKTVLMPGDPLRAKFIAHKYLKNPQLVNNVRGMLAFTGTYKNIELTIMGSGMGIPSMGIYASELYEFYDVQKIIRVGSCGAHSEKINLYDIVVANQSITQGTYYEQVFGEKNYSLNATQRLIDQTKASVQRLNLQAKTHFGVVNCGEAFYKTAKAKAKMQDFFKKENILASEMEAFALYTNAKRFNREALTILSVSDHSLTGKVITAEARQNSFTDMMELALDIAINI